MVQKSGYCNQLRWRIYHDLRGVSKTRLSLGWLFGISSINIGGFPKIVGFPPKSSILIGFSIVFTIHLGVLPLFLETPKFESTKISAGLNQIQPLVFLLFFVPKLHPEILLGSYPQSKIATKPLRLFQHTFGTHP